MKHVAILGRQPALGIAELERVFGGSKVKLISNNAVTVECNAMNIQKLGGIPKAGIIIDELQKNDWHSVSQKVVQYYNSKWSTFEGKITLGISTYGFDIDVREVQKTGIILKQKLKKSGISLRLIPNTTPDLNTAVSHHNKLGLSPNKVELLIVRSNNSVIIAESTGSQNITAYANRDQKRPKRDAFVGMLPPKLAQIMINLAVGPSHPSHSAIVSSVTLEPEFNKAPGPLVDPERSSDAKNSSLIGDQNQGKLRILDPFCGTGVILQEAALMGFSVYGTDLSEKMIRYSRDNLNWLTDSHHIKIDWYLHEGDAMTTKWQQPIDAVVGEAYLGQPFSAPPSPAKLEEVKQNCNHIISEFLKNLASQIKSGTPVCLAIPAWRDQNGNLTHLPLISTVARLGYKPHEFTNISQNDLLYFRENQIVARELMVLTKI
jgi:tRNA G10  N-methylase Trm11